MKRLILLIVTILCFAGCKKQDVECLFLWEQNPVVFFGENPYYYSAIGEPKFTICFYKDNYNLIQRIYTSKDVYRFSIRPDAKYAIVEVEARLEKWTGHSFKYHGVANKVWDLSKNKTIQVTKNETMYDGDSNWLLHTYFQ